MVQVWLRNGTERSCTSGTLKDTVAKTEMLAWLKVIWILKCSYLHMLISLMKYMLPHKLLYYSTLRLDHAIGNIEGGSDWSDFIVCKEGRPVRRKTLKDLKDSSQAALLSLLPSGDAVLVSIYLLLLPKWHNGIIRVSSQLVHAFRLCISVPSINHIICESVPMEVPIEHDQTYNASLII